MVTLYHWDLPQPLQDEGGFMNVSLVEHFVNYARIVIEALPQVDYWITFNEPRIICLFGYETGIIAPGLQQNVYQCAYVLLKAHAEVYHMYKKEFSNYKGESLDINFERNTYLFSLCSLQKISFSTNSIIRYYVLDLV